MTTRPSSNNQASKSGDMSKSGGFDPDFRPVFKIGINCDAETLFNKDPKDPNKYECEGSKTGIGFQQMSDYLVNMCKEHPLLEYIEDPFAETDPNGYRVFKTAIAEQYPQVRIGMQAPFKDSRLEKVIDITKPKTAEEIEEEKLASRE